MDRCVAILAGGVFNTEVITSSETVKTAWEKWWFSQSASEARSNVSAGIGMVVPSFLLNGSFDDERFESWKQSNAAQYAGNHFSQRDIDVLKSVASKEILSAFVDCVQQTEVGLKLFAQAPHAGGATVVWVKYTPEGSNVKLPIVQATDMANARLITPVPGLRPSEFLLAGSELPLGVRPVLVQVINPEEPALFDIWTDMGSTSTVIAEGDRKKVIELPAYSFSNCLHIEIGGLPYGEVSDYAAPEEAVGQVSHGDQLRGRRSATHPRRLQRCHRQSGCARRLDGRVAHGESAVGSGG
jgi:hypothetical protein